MNTIQQGLIDVFVRVNPGLAEAMRDMHAKGIRKSIVKAYLKKMETRAPLIYNTALLYLDQLWDAQKVAS